MPGTPAPESLGAGAMLVHPLGENALAAVLGAVAAVGGVALAYETDWPVGFFIATLVMLEYIAARRLAPR